MKLSVLHISDLHRDASNHVSNQNLLDSLERDRERYSQEDHVTIQPPDLIVVSGDIVQGVIDDSNPTATLSLQYEEAYHFLNTLTSAFVAGNKDRVIIVPGNHDASACSFYSSIQPMQVSESNHKALADQLFSQGTILRWSWNSFSLYRIADTTAYRQRFDAFIEFYNAFYNSNRQYPQDPSQQFDLFDLPEFDMTFVGFNSSYNNDMFNKQGFIHPDCISQARSRLRRPEYGGRLRLAVWHHNIEGPPRQTDYLDPEITDNLIDSGYSIGFHGHQHKPRYLQNRFRYGIDRSITVIGAGTICGTPPYRYGRAYNIVELDTTTNTGRLHVREMKNDDFQLPIWGPAFVHNNSLAYLDFSFDPPPGANAHGGKLTTMLARAKRLYEAGHHFEASQLVKGSITQDGIARRLFLECLIVLDDSQGIIDNFDPPQAAGEAVALMDALWIKGEKRRLGQVLDLSLVHNSSDPSVIEVGIKYRARLQR